MLNRNPEIENLENCEIMIGQTGKRANITPPKCCTCLKFLWFVGACCNKCLASPSGTVTSLKEQPTVTNIKWASNQNHNYGLYWPEKWYQNVIGQIHPEGFMVTIVWKEALHPIPIDDRRIYHLVNVYKTMGNHHANNGKFASFQWPWLQVRKQ